MSHYIRTIHTDYTARAVPSSSTRTPLPSYRPHPGLPTGPADPLALPFLSSGAQPRRSRRTPGPSHRRTAPPPPPRTSYAPTHLKFDPFSDDTDSPTPPPSPVLYRTPPSPRLTPASLTLSSPHPRAPQPKPRSLFMPTPTLPPPAAAPTSIDPNARSRLVAGILLNRVHAVGRPMRRRSFEGPREYVKSGLSSVISVEA